MASTQSYSYRLNTLTAKSIWLQHSHTPDRLNTLTAKSLWLQHSHTPKRLNTLTAKSLWLQHVLLLNVLNVLCKWWAKRQISLHRDNKVVLCCIVILLTLSDLLIDSAKAGMLYRPLSTLKLMVKKSPKNRAKLLGVHSKLSMPVATISGKNKEQKK